MFHSLDDYKDDYKDIKKENKNIADKKRLNPNSKDYESISGFSLENTENEKWLKNTLKFEDKEKYSKMQNKIKITLYKNGFLINDEEFRDNTKPENIKFMQQIEKGYIPQELIKKGYKDLGIELISQKNKDYEHTKEFKAFIGEGLSVGNINTTGLKIDENLCTKVDKSKPVCSIDIRLYNGEVVSEEFNLTNTVKDIMNFVSQKSNTSNFELLEGFPPKPIKELEKTIEELKIQGSLLTQRIC